MNTNNRLPPSIIDNDLFVGMPARVQEYLRAQFERRQVPEAECLVEAGQRAHFMALIESGEVILESPNGDMRVLGPGDCFGESMARYGVPASFSAKTTLETTLWSLRREDWIVASELAALMEKPTAVRSQPSGPNHWGWLRNTAIVLSFLLMGLLILGQPLIDYCNQRLPRLAVESGQTELAERYLRLALNWQPDSASLYDALGVLRYQQGSAAEAANAFHQAVALDNQAASAQNNLGVALIDLARPTEAIEHLQAAAHLDPGNAASYANLGHAFLAAGDLDAASHAYQRAFELDASQVDALAIWAGIAMEQGRIEPARQAWEQILQTNPTHTMAQRGLGAVMVLEGQPYKALDYLEAVRTADPRDAVNRFYLGLAFESLDRNEEAMLEFGHALVYSEDDDLRKLALEHLQSAPEDG